MRTTMRKAERQAAIVEIVREQQIATQAELRDALAARGVECDQGTVSRDIRELGLVKAASDDGGYYYATIDAVSPAVRPSRISVLRQMVKASIPSGNLIVVKCGPGNAPAVGEAFDHLGIAEIIGTVAGDDTLLAVVREGTSASAVADKLMKEIGLK
jgi:transcriptional regulator of arginine metabolism